MQKSIEFEELKEENKMDATWPKKLNYGGFGQ